MKSFSLGIVAVPVYLLLPGVRRDWYATCFASSAKLFKNMTTGAPASCAAATARYLELLGSGGNDHPMAKLQKAEAAKVR